MGQSMVKIAEELCTGCDLCLLHCPFEALVPYATIPMGRTHPKRPILVLDSACVGCLSCIGSCPTKALTEVLMPPVSKNSPILFPRNQPKGNPIKRFSDKDNFWP